MGELDVLHERPPIFAVSDAGSAAGMGTAACRPACRHQCASTHSPATGARRGGSARGRTAKAGLSGMEKFLEIVRYEYGDNISDHNLYIWVKQKVANVPAFCMQFLDRDGMMVDPSDSSCGTGILMHFLPGPGQVAKIDVSMPPAGHMARVVAARVHQQ